MKANLEFNLDEPTDNDQFELYSNANKMYSVLCELDSQLRSWIKYGNDFKTQLDALEATRKMLREGMFWKEDF